MIRAGYAKIAIKDLVGDWYYIEHNLHTSQCTGGKDTFTLNGNKLYLTKFCTKPNGSESAVTLEVQRRVATSESGDFIVTLKGGGWVGNDVASNYVVYTTGGEGDDKYMVIGNGQKSGSVNKSLYFAIVSRKSKMNVCDLAKIESTLGRYGIDTTDVIRERGALTLCNGK